MHTSYTYDKLLFVFVSCAEQVTYFQTKIIDFGKKSWSYIYKQLKGVIEVLTLSQDDKG